MMNKAEMDELEEILQAVLDQKDKQCPKKDEYVRGISNMRIASLKLAYDTAHKLGGFSTMRNYNMENSPESLEKDLEDVMKLADINFNYLMNINNNLKDEIENMEDEVKNEV